MTLLKSCYFACGFLMLNMIIMVSAFAEEAEVMVSTKSPYHDPMYAIAAGLTMALAAFGGALAQGRVGAAAMEGIARNPQSQRIMFIPMIITLALIESFVIFSFAIAMIIAGKLP